MTPNRDLFYSLLQSRSLREEVVRHFDLCGRYEVDDPHDAAGQLKERTRVSVNKEGVISVTVQETDPELAAELANYHVEALRRLLDEHKVTEAGRQREFVAERLKTTKRELSQAEEGLRAFQEKHKFVAMDEQAKGVAEVARDLQIEIAALEAWLAVYSKNFPPSNVELQQLEMLTAEKQRQLARLQYGRNPGTRSEMPTPDPESGSDLIAIVDLPEVGLEYSRLRREVMLKSKVYTLLVEELERAKIEEARGTPEIRLLDKAAPATRKARPRTLLNAMLVGLLFLFIGIFLAFVFDYLEALGVKPAFWSRLCGPGASEFKQPPELQKPC